MSLMVSVDTKHHVYLLSVTSQKDILSVQINYFANLCKKKVNGVNMMAKIDYFMKDTSIPRISEEQRKSCEGALPESKVLSVLKQMKTGSAPGRDGIAVKFFKVFWSHLGKLITASFNSTFKNGKMSSQCKVVITLIHNGKELPQNE